MPHLIAQLPSLCAPPSALLEPVREALEEPRSHGFRTQWQPIAAYPAESALTFLFNSTEEHARVFAARFAEELPDIRFARSPIPTIPPRSVT